MKKEPMFFFLLSFIGIVIPDMVFSNFTLKISFYIFLKIGVFHDLGEGKFQKENYVYK